MDFRHSPRIRSRFPELAAGAMRLRGPFAGGAAATAATTFLDAARDRLAMGGEGEFPEIQAWRRAFARMGLKPTQYRSAAEALLRRLRQEGDLPRIHPLIDLANAVSVGFAVPIAVFDLARVTGGLEVREATGEELHLAFAGTEEHPDPGEVIFADGAGRSHARRWCHRQSAVSAVRPETREVLVVTEAMHAGGEASVARVLEALAAELPRLGATVLATARPTADRPVFDFEPPEI